MSIADFIVTKVVKVVRGAWLVSFCNHSIIDKKERRWNDIIIEVLLIYGTIQKDSSFSGVS